MIARLLVLVALLAAAAIGLLLASPAHADTDGAAMSLSVDPADTIPCPEGKEPSGSEPLFCVPGDSTFRLQVVADAVPASGYILAQAWVHYGDDLGDQAANGMVKAADAPWFDCETALLLVVPSDQGGDTRLDSVYATCPSGGPVTPLPPSFYKGVLFEFELTCDNGTHTIDLFALGEAPAGDQGSHVIDGQTQTDEIVPEVTGAEINCFGPPFGVGGVALGDGVAPPAPASDGVSAWWFVAVAVAVVLAASVGALAFVRRTR